MEENKKEKVDIENLKQTQLMENVVIKEMREVLKKKAESYQKITSKEK